MKFQLCSFLRAFCFPPCPRSILEHLALKPPPLNYSLTLLSEEDASYTLGIIAVDGANYLELINLELIKQACLMKDVHFSFALNGILCLYYRVKPATSTTILYSHGSKSDLGSAIFVCVWLANHLHCNILSYDYSGYGLSPGKPSEKRIYENIESAFKLLEVGYHCLPEDVILYGKGLGSAPTIHLASKIPVRGVVVQSGFTSLLNIAIPCEHPRTMCCDIFCNFDKISKVFSPVLVIHGTEDTKVDLSHGKAIFERCPVPVQPLWVDGGTHYDLESHSELLSRLKQFVSVELPDIQKASK